MPPTDLSNADGEEIKKAADKSATNAAAQHGANGLVLPDSVALMLDTALSGDKAPSGTPGLDGRPRSKNLAVLVGTVRVMTTARGDDQRVVTNLGAVEYRYELSINEVIGDETGAARTSYHLPITMSDAVRSRYQHLLQDGQRIALLGPLGMEEFYDRRFQRDAYDAGRRTWDIRIDVLSVQEADENLPDMAWVQLEGEVVERPRIYARQYGEQRGLVEQYASVTLRYREVLAAAYGRAVRPVVKSVPVEVLVASDEEIIMNSDALLRPGNKVRIEGRLSPAVFRLGRRAMEDDTVKGALDRTRTQFEARNADMEQQMDTYRQQRQLTQERNARDGRQSQLPAAPRQQPLNQDALEQRIARAQQRLLTGRRVRVEVGYVELLHGEAVRPDDRTRLIVEGEERRRSRTATRRLAPPAPDERALVTAQDQDTVQAMQTSHAEQHTSSDEASAIPLGQPSSIGALRPRKSRAATQREAELGTTAFVADDE